MGVSTALYTSLTGLNANSQMLSVAGNNIANVNTTAFKASRASFETQFSLTLANGSAPGEVLGGSNPAQIGFGTRVAEIRRDFTSGSVQPTGVSTDMAIDGNGFFIVNQSGNQLYTRAGNFTLDRDFNLVNADGALVQGYGIDSDFNIIEGQLTNLSVPLGNMTIAEATTESKFAGNLNAGGDIATQGGIIQTDTLYSDATATTQATTATALTSVYDALGTQMFATGDVITVTGATKGGATLDDKTFEVGATNTTGSDANGTTMQDLMDFFEAIFGIDTGVSGGVTMAAGVVSIEGNSGTANDIAFDDANMVVNVGASPTTPMVLSKTQTADGEAVRTTFVAYDSLGTPLSVDMTIVLEQKSDTGTQWRFYVQSDDDTDLARHLGSGLVNFDTNGALVSATDNTVSINRDLTGAGTPQAIDITFEDPFGSVTALYDVRSQISQLSQDGSPLGTLADFSVGESGVITGIFTNGLLRNLGQVVLAKFANDHGLLEIGNNLYQASVNSGDALALTPGTGGAGTVLGRSLELSNVDLAAEFVTLINASTGFSANSRVLTTSERLIQELLASTR